MVEYQEQIKKIDGNSQFKLFVMFSVAVAVIGPLAVRFLAETSTLMANVALVALVAVLIVIHIVI